MMVDEDVLVRRHIYINHNLESDKLKLVNLVCVCVCFRKGSKKEKKMPFYMMPTVVCNWFFANLCVCVLNGV